MTKIMMMTSKILLALMAILSVASGLAAPRTGPYSTLTTMKMPIVGDGGRRHPSMLTAPSSTVKSLILRSPRGGGGGGGRWMSLLKQSIRSTGEKNPVPASRPLDFRALGKYTLALAVQMALIFGLFTGIDKTIAWYKYDTSKIPLWANGIFFYAFNLNTSLFSPLPSRCEQEKWEYQRRNQPSWTPPGWVFAVMWPFFVFGTRAATASIMVQKTGLYANSAVMALMFHLCVANLWNTVNNVDRRLGFSVPIMYGLVLSKVYAAYLTFLVYPLAGKWLAATLSWLLAAAALQTQTWRINPDSETHLLEPLYPAKGKKWETRFRWEDSG